MAHYSENEIAFFNQLVHEYDIRIDGREKMEFRNYLITNDIITTCFSSLKISYNNSKNEIIFAVKGEVTYPVHLNISINESFIERFSGDGICVATPAGSTAYNYSLGGSIVDPGLDLLQVTPIAPMKSIAYRSFTSSLLLPPDGKLNVLPCDESDRKLNVIFDGRLASYEDVNSITMELSSRKVNLVRFDDSNFWDKVKDKFL